jgi:hypothetical protein
MLKTVAATTMVAAISMLFVGSSSAVAQTAVETDRAPALSAAPQPQTTTAPRRPIAFGYINTDGTVASGTGNFTSVFDSTNKWYAITITGRNYFFSNFATVVTPSFNSGAPAPICGTGSVSGKLLVACYNTAGARVQPPAGFGFLVHSDL